MRFAEDLSAEERLMLGLEDSHIHMNVLGVFVFEKGSLACDGGVDIDRIREYVESRLYRVPRLRQRLVHRLLDAVWVDDRNFNIQYHVRHTRLPHPGDDRQLKRLCGQIASVRLDRERPLWEICVVEGLENERFGLIVKIHQSICAGAWGIGLMEALLTAVPRSEIDSAPVWLPRAAPETAELLRRRLLRSVRAPFSMLRAAVRVAREADVRAEALQSLAVFVPSEASSGTPLNQPVGPHRRIDWLTIDTSAAREVADRFDCSLQTVGLATLAGALGRFFAQRGITPPEQRDLTFRVACAQQPGGLACGGPVGDLLSWAVTHLDIAESDPVKRLESIIKALAAAEPISVRLITTASEWIGLEIASAFARRQLGQGASNLTFDHLAGPDTPRFLLGARLLEAFPSLPLVPEQAVRLAVFAYEDRLHWCVNSDWDLLPDLHDLVDALQACFEELCKRAKPRAA
jgi:diacylglycerol O-acyltransferase